MGVYLPNMEMPKEYGPHEITITFFVRDDGTASLWGKEVFIPHEPLEVIPIPPHGILRKRLVYRGEVYNALEAERVNYLDGILTDPYKDGFHDGLKRALQILANEVEDAPTIIEAEEDE